LRKLFESEGIHHRLCLDCNKMRLKNSVTSTALFLISAVHSQAVAQSPVTQIITSQSDLTTTKLALDKLVDPSIDETAIRRELDGLAAQAHTIAGPNATNEQKLNAVRRVIYKAGPWNDNRPFSYDLDDPLGLNVQNKLLSTYLRTRRGGRGVARLLQRRPSRDAAGHH
jgi:hypothetical protein